MNQLWIVIITLTTVGYGDFVPETFGGKFIAIITALWGAFIISLFVLVQSNIFELDSDQK